MKRIAVFVSGTGSNARKILEYFIDHEAIEVAMIISNRKNAKALQLAEEYDISTFVLTKSYLYDSEDILRILEVEHIDLIVLAGFLWQIPDYLVQAYTDRMINIHPSLLPKYGGKGMYGLNIHKAVHEAGEDTSGLTIHIVNEEYDKGKILHQEEVSIKECCSPEEIASKILKKEHQVFPKVIEKHLQQSLN